MSFTWSLGVSLAVHFDAVHFGLAFLHFVLFDTTEEIISTLGMFDVFDSQVDSLGDDAVAELFVDDNTNSSPRHIEHAASLSVVVLVRHAFVDGSISLHVNDITHTVRLQVS